jgi:hypothetical protein
MSLGRIGYVLAESFRGIAREVQHSTNLVASAIALQRRNCRIEVAARTCFPEAMVAKSMMMPRSIPRQVRVSLEFWVTAGTPVSTRRNDRNA